MNTICSLIAVITLNYEIRLNINEREVYMKIIIVTYFITVISLMTIPANIRANEIKNRWTPVSVDQEARRFGAGMVLDAENNRALLVGGDEFKQKAVGGVSFNFKDDSLEHFVNTNPPVFRNRFNNGNGQSIYVTESNTIFFMNPVALRWQGVENNITSLDLGSKEWKILKELDSINHIRRRTAIYDAAKSEIIIIGSDMRLKSSGWLTGATFNVKTHEITPFEFGTVEEQKAHKQRWLDRNTLSCFEGKIRLYWYRDKNQAGTDNERKDLLKDLEVIIALENFSDYKEELEKIKVAIADKQLLTALHATKTLLRKYESIVEEKAPMPCARSNSPMVLDIKRQKGVLFGGDHEDYLLNDTWVLDLATKTWTRKSPKLVPSPRAGHALTYLPKSEKILLFGGYKQSSSIGYGSSGEKGVDDNSLWIYDIEQDLWQILKLNESSVAPLGNAFCYNYQGVLFTTPLMVANNEDKLFLAYTSKKGQRGTKGINMAFSINIDSDKLDATTLDKKGVAPNVREHRDEIFTTDYSDKVGGIATNNFEQMPENVWVKLAQTENNPMQGCRAKDWTTAILDEKNDQMLFWGGGHCVRSASVVVHYSLDTGRLVESYNADETYGGQGRDDHSLMGRPWVSMHNYNLYAYDNNSGLMVSARGYLYDPVKMEWLKTRTDPTFYYVTLSTLLEKSAHGVIAWGAIKRGSNKASLSLYEHGKGWRTLETKGEIKLPYADSTGVTYDSKRDRLLLLRSNPRKSFSTIKSYSFKTSEVEDITPENWAAVMSDVHNFREVVYVEHADWMIAGHSKKVGDKFFTRVLDLSSNKAFLIDTGAVGFKGIHSMGFSYDKKRKIIIAINKSGIAFALKINPKTAIKITE